MLSKAAIPLCYASVVVFMVLSYLCNYHLQTGMLTSPSDFKAAHSMRGLGSSKMESDDLLEILQAQTESLERSLRGELLILQSKLDASLHNISAALPTTTKQSEPVEQEQAKETLLSVPFYVYQDSLLWSDFKYGITSDKHDLQLLSNQEAQNPSKHSDDYWFMKSALEHPMRTLDPDKAQLFVVPSLLNYASEAIYGSKVPGEASKKACNGDHCNQELYEHVQSVLSHSKFYRRSNGSDHILVNSAWHGQDKVRGRESPILRSVHQIGFEDAKDSAPNRLTIPSTYVGNPCPLANNKTHDFVMVGSLWNNTKAKRKRARFQTRRNVCEWLEGSNYTNRFSVCGKGRQCPNLAQSRYGFHVRGDTLGANRLMDTLLSGTVPIFTDPGQYDILPDFIDWKSLSVFVDVRKDRDTYLRGLQELLDRNDYEEKLQRVRANRDLLDWRTGVPFDVYMFIFQKHILPGTVPTGSAFQNPYNFSALRL